MTSFNSILCLVFCAALLIRILVGFSPHSGQDNYHGAAGAYGGDFEAQRHWMELTWNLPRSEWYHYDLDYWGLDYPPLSAYQSFLCGLLSHYLVGPESVALYTSRGYEDATHKAFLRGTVIALDLLVYGSAAYYLTLPSKAPPKSSDYVRLLTVLIQPAILLIDHGHFQYNTTALGLSLWAFYLCTHESLWKQVMGCVVFTCALGFKQMTLYYAPAIFAYLLGKCCQPQSTNNETKRRQWSFLVRFVSYGVAVIVTLVVLFWPFVMTPRESQTTLDGRDNHDSSPLNRFSHVMRRIFPVHRGLLEDKVANLWCALSVKPFRLAQRVPPFLQPVAALGLTVTLCLPACLQLFRCGQSSHAVGMTTTQKQQQDQQILLLGASSTALSFFLGAFHVHEKSILLALAPATFVLQDNELDWFAILTTWSLYPLVILDRLQVAYGATLVLYLCTRRLCRIWKQTEHSLSQRDETSFFQTVQSWVFGCSILVMMGLHLAETRVKPPPHLPDLFAVLWAMAGCACFVTLWGSMVYQLYRIPIDSDSRTFEHAKKD